MGKAVPTSSSSNDDSLNKLNVQLNTATEKFQCVAESIGKSIESISEADGKGGGRSKSEKKPLK